jgi:hypothetical protein
MSFSVTLVYFAADEDIKSSVDIMGFVKYLLIKTVQMNKASIAFYDNRVRIKFLVNNMMICKAASAIKPCTKDLKISDFKYYLSVNLC